MLTITPKDSNVDEVAVRNVFGNFVNVLDYYKIFDKESCEAVQDNGKFIKFGWHDISEYTPFDKRLENIGIRSKGNEETSIENIRNSLTYAGWDVSHFPIIISTNGVLLDGRTRILAAMREGEKFLPCAIFEYEDDRSLKTRIDNGLLANEGAPREFAKGKDFISAGVKLILNGDIPMTLPGIEHWLYNDVKIRRVMSNVGGNITKLAERILKRAENSSKNQLILVQDRKLWLDWLEISINKHSAYYRKNFGIQSIKDVTLYVSNGNKHAITFCDHILPNASAGRVTNIILYSMDDDPYNTINSHKQFTSAVQKYLEMVYNVVNRELLDEEQITIPESSTLFRVIGVLPQFVEQGHRKLYDNHKLVSMEDLLLLEEPEEDELGNTLFK